MFTNRSQKTSTFQKDVGIFLNQHGLTRAGINTGPVLGLSTGKLNVTTIVKWYNYIILYISH